jgi:tRNA (guanine37-N1)-methyltransferase
MKFDIITIFPKIFDSYFSESIVGRGIKKKIFSVKAHDLRKFARGKHKKTDDRPYGGGAGMVLSALPVLRAVEKIIKSSSKINPKERKVVLLSAKGKQFTQKMAVDWSKKLKSIIFISGRYEGTDERVKKALKAEEISIGPYVLTDGDVAIMAMVSAVSRLIPGVIKLKSLEEESHWNLLLKKEESASFKKQGLEYPHYTRPDVLEWKGKKYKVPKVLLSGNHEKIKNWREKQSK